MDDSTSAHPRFPPPRRVATAPTTLPEPAVASSSSTSATPLSEGLVETLYSHPNVKIIAFTAAGRAFRGSGFPSGEAPGTLSWSSHVERTIAVGPFRIYRAPGSVSFLNCGSALQPILPKSQVWCIDEINSKFILQIRRPSYWRIELPVAEAEDQLRAEALREVFDKILQFEKTECPFKRAFTVELPEPPETPVKYKPWTPVRRSMPNTPTDEEDEEDDEEEDDDDDDDDEDDDDEDEDEDEDDDEEEDEDDSDSDSSDEDASPTSPVATHPRPTTPTPSRDKKTPGDSKSPSTPWYVRAQVDELETKIGIEGTEWIDISNATCPLRPSGLHGQDNQSNEPRSPISDAEWQQYDALEYPHHTGRGPSSPRNDDDESRQPLFQPLLVPSNPREGLYISPQFQNSPAELTTPKARVPPTAWIGAEPPELQDEGLSKSPPEDDGSTYELHEGTGSQRDRMKARLRRTAGFAVTRSATLPSHFKLPADQSPKPSASSSINVSGVEEKDLRRDSEESFRSVQSRHSTVLPLSVSPSISQPNANGTITADHDTVSQGGDISETRSGWETGSDRGSSASRESVATAPDDSPPIKTVDAFPTSNTPEVVEEPPATIAKPQRRVTRHRATTGSISVRHRPFSPLPSAANLFAPAPTVERRPHESKLEAAKWLPMAIILKTLEMLLGPPSYLIALMLKVAAKIVAGEWRGLVFGYGDDGEEIPVQWDYSDGELSDLSDDDSYMGAHPSRNNRRRSRAATNEERAADSPNGSEDSRNWGVD